MSALEENGTKEASDIECDTEELLNFIRTNSSVSSYDREDIEERDEQRHKLFNKIISYLSMVGYHRARVATISDYDRVIGGITFVLSRLELLDHSDPNTWIFEEQENKSMDVKVKECMQISKAFFLLSTQNVSAFAFVKQEYSKIYPMLNIILKRLVSIEGARFLFRDFNNSLQCRTLDEGRLKSVASFREALLLPNSMRVWKTSYHEKFDYSIVMDKKVNGRQIMAEYMSYNRTGKRLYPSCFNDDTLEQLKNIKIDPHVLLDDNVYKELSEKANEYFGDLSGEEKEVFDKIIGIMGIHRYGKRMGEIYNRILVEHEKLLKVNDEYEEIREFLEKEADNKLLDDVLLVESGLEESIQKDCESALTCCKYLEEECAEIQKKIHQTVGDWTKEQYKPYCALRREKWENLEAKRKEISKRISTLKALRNKAESALISFQDHKKEYVETDTKIVEFEPTDDRVDRLLENELSCWIIKSHHAVSKLSLELANNENKQIKDLQTQFESYMTDSRICMSDLFHKVRFLVQRRYELIAERDKLWYEVCIAKEKTAAFSFMISSLRLANKATIELRAKIVELQCESPSFSSVLTSLTSQ